MGWIEQAGIFFSEVKATRVREKDEEQESVSKEDMEFVSSASEARLLDVSQGASFLIALTTMLLIAVVIWSLVMEVDEVAKAQGKVIPSKQVQVVQTLEGGIIKKINAVEGQSVKVDDILIVIDDVYAKSDLSENVIQYNTLLSRYVTLTAGLQEKRLVTFPQELQPHIEIISRARQEFNANWTEIISNVKELEFAIDQRAKEYAAAKSALKIAKQDSELAQEELALNKDAYEKEIITRVDFIKIKHQANDARAKLRQAEHNVPKAQAALSEADEKKGSYIASQRSKFEKERNEVKQKLDSMHSKGVSLQAKVSHSVVKSPVIGTVKKINFNTIGGIIRPGMDIMEIIPTDDKLLVEAKVKPKDIGFIHKGLKAKVKLTAFDFSTYGGLDGTVQFVSADTITDKKGISFFLVRILTEKNYITDKKGMQHTIIPGMQTEVNIVVDKKSIFTYILKPMLK